MSALAELVPAETIAAIKTEIAAHPYRVLGSYRFLLASLVLVSHASPFLPEIVGRLGFGNIGVLLFFVVSGFVISEALDLFYRRSTTRFLMNRALKIYPAYWAALPIAYAALAWAGEPVHADPWGLLVNASLLLAYLPKGGTLLAISVAWAVIIEFQFYFAAGAVALLGRHRHGAALVRGVLLLSLLGYVFVWWTDAQTRFYGALQFAPFFVLGVSLYFAVAKRDTRLLPLVLIAAMLSGHAYYAYNARGLSADVVGPAWHVIASTAIFISLGALLAALVATRAPRAFERIDKRLGDLTYAVYLVHSAVLVVLLKLDLGNTASFVIAVVASFALAVLIRAAVERPVVRLRNRLRGLQLYD